MNQAAPVRSGGSHLASLQAKSESRRLAPQDEELVRRQARQVDDRFKAIARRVLVDDDPTSEMPVRQLRVCAALFEGARSMKELSVELGVSQSAITQLADRLEAAGMVTRGPIGEDRRVRNLELTQRARKMLRLREERRIGRVMDLLGGLDPEQRRAVMKGLDLLSGARGD